MNAKRGTARLLGMALLALAAWSVGCGLPDPNKTYNVRYGVRGTAESADITIEVPGGGTEQRPVRVPYTSPAYTFKGMEFAYISAQNNGETGSLEVEIVANGVRVRSARCSGAYSIASTNWTVGEAVSGANVEANKTSGGAELKSYLNTLIVAVIIGLIPAAIARRKGRNFFAWWIFGAALFIVALPWAIFLKREAGAGEKVCPHCAEIIKGDAKVCRYCGRDLPPMDAEAPGSP